MGLQKEILRRTFEGTVKVQTGVDAQGNPVYENKTYSVGTAALIGGTPGQIYDVAYGPVVHTTTLAAAADIGSFVEGQGIIINAPEYALYGTGVGQGAALAPSLTLPAGSVVSCMTAGHVWIQYKNLATILDKMNAAVIWQQDGATDDNDLLAVEVNGMKAYGPGDSTDNG
jgi:hypothetical protein